MACTHPKELVVQFEDLIADKKRKAALKYKITSFLIRLGSLHCAKIQLTQLQFSHLPIDSERTVFQIFTPHFYADKAWLIYWVFKYWFYSHIEQKLQYILDRTRPKLVKRIHWIFRCKLYSQKQLFSKDSRCAEHSDNLSCIPKAAHSNLLEQQPSSNFIIQMLPFEIFVESPLIKFETTTFYLIAAPLITCDWQIAHKKYDLFGN